MFEELQRTLENNSYGLLLQHQVMPHRKIEKS